MNLFRWIATIFVDEAHEMLRTTDIAPWSPSETHESVLHIRNILFSHAFGVFISQLIRYARACSSYECFILKALQLSNKLLGQRYVKERLKSFLSKLYDRYGDLTKQYEVPLSRMLHDILDDDHLQWHPPLIRHYTNFLTFSDLDLITEFDFLPYCVRFPWNICNGCGMPTEDAHSSGHLVLSYFGTCMCSNVNTYLSWICLVSGLLNFNHPYVLLFCFLNKRNQPMSSGCLGTFSRFTHVRLAMTFEKRSR